jgi:anaerobic ribonucleoside-triphosphate reductase activating protein
MLKYTDTEVVFDEVPNEITLAINISNCPFHCPGCHSPELWEDIGDILDRKSLSTLLTKNRGISCVSFMGGDKSSELINDLASFIKETFPKLKISWYSGRDRLSENISLNNFDYIKLGPYIESLGGLDKKTTNQRFYKVLENKLIDITNLFWK